MDDIFKDIELETYDDESVTKEYAQKFGDGESLDLDKLKKAKWESDQFINRLKSELAELRQEVTQKATMDEILTQIRQANKEPGSPVHQPPETQTPKDLPDIEEVVSSLLEKKEVEKKVRSNEQIVADKLRERFGSMAQAELNNKARELGTSVQYLQSLARENPKIFFRVTGLDVEPQKSPQTTPPSSRISAPPIPQGKRDRQYYEKMKASNRKEYFSEKTQLQMYKDMKAVLESGNDW